MILVQSKQQVSRLNAVPFFTGMAVIVPLPGDSISLSIFKFSQGLFPFSINRWRVAITSFVPINDQTG